MPHNQQTREFLQRLFGQCKDSTLTIMTLPDKTIHHYPSHELDRFADEGQRLGAVANTYFDVNPKRKDLQKGVRGGSNDVQYLCCLHADIDVAGPAHVDEEVWDRIYVTTLFTFDFDLDVETINHILNIFEQKIKKSLIFYASSDIIFQVWVKYENV